MSDSFQEQNTELAQKFDALRQNKVPRSELHSTIWDLGKAEYLPARPVIERFLTDEDSDIRLAALQVLVIRFEAREHTYWEMAKSLLTDAAFSGDRIDGGSLLGLIKRNTQDEETLRVLASVVNNSQEEPLVRRNAYEAMLSIIHYDPFEARDIRKFGTNIEQAVDWDFVNRYLSHSQ